MLTTNQIQGGGGHLRCEMKYDVLDLKIDILSCKIRLKFQNSLEILLKVSWISIYQAFVHGTAPYTLCVVFK